jgi:hypothetical protein
LVFVLSQILPAALALKIDGGRYVDPIEKRRYAFVSAAYFFFNPVMVLAPSIVSTVISTGSP